MYKHILNLKKKVSPIVIERVIFKKESLLSRVFRIAFSIAVVFTIVWSVSKAEEILDNVLPTEAEPTVSFSLAGIVKEVSANKIILTRSVGFDASTNVFEIDILTNEQVIETNTYEGLTIADILVDDKIIIQGFKRDGIFYSRRIISFAPRFPDTAGINGVIEPEIAEEEVLDITVATTTDDLLVDLATTTDNVIEDAASTTTEEVLTETSTSTTEESITETSTSTSNETLPGTENEAATSTPDESLTETENTNSTSTDEQTTEENVTPTDSGVADQQIENVVEPETPVENITEDAVDVEQSESEPASDSATVSE